MNLEKILDEHRRRLVRVAERRGVNQVKKLYDRVAVEAKQKLEASLRQKRRMPYTVETNKIVLAQARQGQVMLADDVYGELGTVTREAQMESIYGTASSLRKLTKFYRGEEAVIPIDEASSIAGLIGKRADELDGMHVSALESWGKRTYATIHEKLSTSLALGETTEQAMDRITDKATGGLDLEWWQAERIVRTECSWAYNSSTADSLKEAAQDVPELRQRWVEHCDDESGQPNDDRVGEDSIALHGQVVATGKPFHAPPWITWPKGQEKVFYFPPSRPNDRACLFPWFPGMGVIAYEIKAGRKVNL